MELPMLKKIMLAGAALAFVAAASVPAQAGIFHKKETKTASAMTCKAYAKEQKGLKQRMSAKESCKKAYKTAKKADKKSAS
jgi:hypothetical protein